MYHAYYKLNNAEIEFYFEEDDVLREIFKVIKSKTAVIFDEYSDWRFYPDHQKILVNLLKDKEGYNDIVDFFESSIYHNQTVYFIGQ